MADKKYLEWHGNQWRVQVKVPESVRAVLGRQRLVKPLHTDSLALANRKKYAVVAELKDEIARAEIEVKRRAKQQTDELLEEALGWRHDIIKERETADWTDDEHPPVYPISLLVTDRAEEIEKREGPERAGYFARIAQGLATPVDAYVDAWLNEKTTMKPRQKIDYRRAVSKFTAWTTSVKLSGALEDMSRKIAGRYVSESLVAADKPPRTINKDISALSSYWKHLVKRGHVEVNVWESQSLPKQKAKREQDRPKRPYTDEEMRTLLNGGAGALLHDAIRIGALSGMRVEEVAKLKVEDCLNGTLHVREAKGGKERKVPTHPDLRDIIARRSNGKQPSDYLFEELKDPKPGSAMERGQKITKGFVTYRRRLGVDERRQGHRQSRVDLHSLRRWFIVKARDALQEGATGYDQWTIADVVGHEKESMALAMTMGVYPGAASDRAMRACVEAVRLPVG
jgi:integrase